MWRELEPEEIEFNDRINAIFLRKQQMSFEEVVRRYRQIEAEFVERDGDNEYRVVETKRRVTEWLLNEAKRTEQPHEVCREIFDELVHRGFSDIPLRHTMSGIYARCCQWNGEFDAGVAVIEPLIAEIEKCLEDPTLAPSVRESNDYDQLLSIHKNIRDELKAGIRKRLMPRSGKWEPEEIAVNQRINAVQFRERKNELSFEEAAREYRQIEAELVKRAGGNEIQATETKRRITEVLLDSAYGTRQSHEVCHGLWEELVQRGFTNEERRHAMSRRYVQCCNFNGKFDAGLAVIEPLVSELESNLEDTTLTEEMHQFCKSNLRTHRQLQDKLKAGIQ